MWGSNLLLHAALAALVQGEFYQDTIAFGTPYGNADDNKTDRQRWAQANQNPNVTKSFQFAPFCVDGVFNSGSNAPDESNVWTLRINVTDFAVPNAVPPYPQEQPQYFDPHITNTVFELDWPEKESFRSALNGSTAPACIAINSGSFLPNVTNLFTEDNESGDCEPVLGTDCVNALLASGYDLDTCRFNFWEDLPECTSTLGASRSYDEYGLGRLSSDFNSNSSAPNISYADVGYKAIANGTDGSYGFLSQSTDVYNATNTTLYEAAATRLYVMVLSIAPFPGQEGLWSQKALCMRVNATQLDVPQDEVSSGGDGGGRDGSGGDSNENSATALMPGGSMTGSALSLAGLGLVMYALL